MRFRRALLMLGVAAGMILALAFYLLAFFPLRDPHPEPLRTSGLLAITGARIYLSPDASPIAQGTILMRDGKIAAVGEQVALPAGTRSVPCAHCIVTAGFWNTHVHFTQRKWSGAEWKQAAELEASLQDMLTSRGFTTVVDLGSNLRDTIPLRRRIEHGELAGPKIYTAGSAQYPPHGLPFYLRASLPRWMQYFMPQPDSPGEAARVESQNIRQGADVLKLFTGSYVEHATVLPMPVGNAQAAVAVAHSHGQLAFAHESSLAGLRVAVEGGVDVLAHAADTVDGVDDAVLGSVVARHMAMIPTLKMFRATVTTDAKYLDPVYAQVRRFHELGGDLMFGTDVGYMKDYDTTDEFRGLALAGLAGKDILRMLTTSPAARFQVSSETGTIEVGKAADLVVLGRDPMQDATAFATVQTTVRQGRVIWQRATPQALTLENEHQVGQE